MTDLILTAARLAEIEREHSYFDPNCEICELLANHKALTAPVDAEIEDDLGEIDDAVKEVGGDGSSIPVRVSAGWLSGVGNNIRRLVSRLHQSEAEGKEARISGIEEAFKAFVIADDEWERAKQQAAATPQMPGKPAMRAYITLDDFHRLMGECRRFRTKDQSHG